MSELLSQALAELNLHPGQCERVQINGHQFEIRCVDDEEKSQFADMVMLEPWVEFPSPATGIQIRACPGKLPLPDPPDIPSDWEENEP